MTPRGQVALVATALALVAAYDFSGRIFVGRDAALRTFNAPRLAPLTQRADAEAIRRQLSAWLPTLSGALGQEVANSDPASWQFSLVGVFRQNGQQFALVSAQQQGGATAELVQVREGDDLRGATVKRIGHTRVTLVRGGTPEELVIFAPPQAASPPQDAPSERATWNRAPAGREPSDARWSGRPGAPVGQVVRPEGSGTAAAAAPPAATEPKPAGAAPKPAGQAKVVEPQELKPGEEVQLPWDLPVVESDGARPEKKR